MRRVLLDDLLRAAAGLQALPPETWHGVVQDWCAAAHLADAVRKRLGARAAARFGAAHLGGRVPGPGRYVGDRDGHARLRAVLAGLEAWQRRMEGPDRAVIGHGNLRADGLDRGRD